MDVETLANDLMTAAAANGGEWTAQPYGDANTAAAVREIISRDERFEVRPASELWPNTVAVRRKL